MRAGDFKAKCLAVLDEVASSRREVIITKRGRPVARLSTIFYNIDDTGWVGWWGQLGYYVPGETSNLTTDVKIGICSPPLSGDLRMYVDDIIFDRYNDGVINYGE
jgi:prevent-host-death family protein